ncbi:GntR family transcriptional regulator [Streptomyces sp. NPDC053427]|uniref:GntR family transcriptional regulator n=1 Tax=Streptomyces sp. NPDC053427 TaxID=3365701 RepID=UPI0037CDB086
MPRPPASRRRPPRVELYERITAAIHDGTFPLGANLPPEPELAARLGVSRPALREVLILLQEDGVITRKHGVGSRVNPNPPVRGLERLTPIEAQLGQGATIDCRLLTVHCDEPTDFSGFHLRISPTSQAYFWETLIQVDGTPACLAHEWAAEESTLAAVDPALVTALGDPEGRQSATSMLAALLEVAGNHPLSSRSSLGATTLGTLRGRTMDRPPETPAVLITQTVSVGSRPVLAAKYLLPAGAPLLNLTPRR